MTSLRSLTRTEMLANPASLEFVRIPYNEYQRLGVVRDRYENLCANLIAGGVDQNTLDKKLLSNHKQDAPREEKLMELPITTNMADKMCQPAPVVDIRSASPEQSSDEAILLQNTCYRADWDESSESTISEEDETFSSKSNETADDLARVAFEQVAVEHPTYEKHATRSLLLMNLANGTRYSDITDVVRGGQILDIFMNSRHRTASLSFVHASQARAFFEHVLKHDLYIKHQRIYIRWNDRQYTLPPSMAYRLGHGASRNFVIRRCHSSITSEEIRTDLEHISNLKVINIHFSDGNCLIETNSVSGAHFARTCMASRSKFRGSQFVWIEDKCAQPLQRIYKTFKGGTSDPAPKLFNPCANRFEVLDAEADSY